MIALLAWELGAGRGHLEHIRPILYGLLNDGWSVVCAVRDLKSSTPFLSHAEGMPHFGSLRIIQAPIFTHRATLPRRPLTSIAEILANIGLADRSLLQPLIEDWWHIIEIVQPNVIIGDFAPSVVAAAQGRVPVIVTGNGWTIPPEGTPIPSLPIRQYDQPAALQAERRICDAVEAVFAGTWRPKGLAQLLRGDARFIFTSHILDPYRYWRRDELSWPPNLALPNIRQQSTTPHILVYLPKRHPAIGPVLSAIGDVGIKTYAFFGGLDFPSPSNITIEQQPLDLPIMLPGARLVVHHGGLGIANWSLAYGKPQATVAVDLEKSLIAHAITSGGFGVSLSNADEGDIAGHIMRAMSLHPQQTLSGFRQSDPSQTVLAVVKSCYDIIRCWSPEY